VLFDLPPSIENSPSHDSAREAMPDGGSVLDVGCGGGIGAFALVPKIKLAIGIDHQPEMLEMFESNAKKFGCDSKVIEGFWPDVADQTPCADVVVSHHVAYNVPNINDFLIALNSKAKNRVVIEIPQNHPLSNMNKLWKHFWNLDRPSGPTADLLALIAQDLGFDAKIEKFNGSMRGEIDLDQAAEFNRIRLCLPKSRTSEVKKFMEENPQKLGRELATIWWDK
jgi:SAM-dependent methyltransferase